MRRIFPALMLCVAAGCAGTAPRAPVELRLVAFNDFHGNLETPSLGVTAADPGSTGARTRVTAGGVAHLATAIRQLRQGHAHTAVVAAGDLVGASPLVSSLFLDEPAVVALSEAGLELSSVGNHEFDRGRAELERLQRGGCSQPQSCFDGRFEGARFQYLAANVFDRGTGKPMFAPYAIRRYAGVPVAFVGAVLRGTPQIVRAAGIATLEFRDEAESVNALVPELRAQGVEAIVLLIHEGGETRGGYDECVDFDGAILDVLERLDPAIDVVVSGHTHQAYICRVKGRLVTSAGSYGRFATAIDLTLDPASRAVVDARATNVVVEPDRFAADPRIASYVGRVAALASARSSQAVASAAGEFTPVASAAGESNLGDLVADSQLAAFRDADAHIAFMNPGGLRSSLASSRADHAVNYGDLYGVLPFGNTLVAMTLTGAQVLQALEQQWRASPLERTRVLQVSEGFRYAWDGSRPVGERVVPGSVFIVDRALDPRARYRVVVNDFLAGGGDGFTVFKEGADLAGGPLDLEALASFLRARPVTAAPPAGRIRKVVSGTTFQVVPDTPFLSRRR
jgi:5'-nucleotidase